MAHRVYTYVWIHLVFTFRAGMERSQWQNQKYSGRGMTYEGPGYDSLWLLKTCDSGLYECWTLSSVKGTVDINDVSGPIMYKILSLLVRINPLASFHSPHKFLFFLSSSNRKSNVLMSYLLPSRANEILAMNKLRLRVAVGLLTGHTSLRAHLYKLGHAERQECRLRGYDKADSGHTVCDCCWSTGIKIWILL
jgi:hypothetical protein